MTALLPAPRAAFLGEIAALTAPELAAMAGRSWRPDDARCLRGDQLARVRAAHVTFDGAVAHGEVIVHHAIAAPTLALLARLYALGFPLRSLRPIDAWDGDDDASMAADNSSGFNFRTVAGTTALSLHALGLAIDLNPIENPWLGSHGLAPAAGAAFLDRAHVRPGMIVRPGPVTALLDEHGWEWGGDWRHASDYHHIVWARRDDIVRACR